MSYLVDTHILLWSLLDPSRLSGNIIQLYNEADEIAVSNISFWEISLKYRLGKLELEGVTPDDLLTAARESHFQIVEISAETMATLYQLPLRGHRDPFDRILIWHAIQNQTTLLSRDHAFEEYQRDGLMLVPRPVNPSQLKRPKSPITAL